MKIYIINLATNTERKRFMQQQLDFLSLDATFFPAFNGHSISSEELPLYYNSKWNIRYTGRDLTPGEIGCALSHVHVYQKMMKEKVPIALILEDDAWLTPSIIHILEALEKKTSPDTAIVYGISEGEKGRHAGILCFPYYLESCKNIFCSHAYVITQKAAALLSQELFPIRHPADCWYWLSKHKIIKLYSVKPCLVTQNNISLKSDIWQNKNLSREKHFYKSVLHKIYRLFWIILDNIIPLSWRNV